MMNVNTWAVGNDGMIRQSINDMRDPNVSLFTETAQDHNQNIIRQGSR
jgi:hypothetical protein